MIVSNRGSTAPGKKSGDVLWKNYINSNGLFFFPFRGQIMTSCFLNLTYWRPRALFSALHLLKIAQWGALQNMWVSEHYQLGPKVHVQYVDAEGQAITRFPSKCHIPVTAFNHPTTCNILTDFIAFMRWRTSLLDFFHVLLSEEDRSLPT